MYVAMLGAALFVGALLAVQTSANLQLNKAMGTPYGASTLQLSMAAGLLALLAIVTGAIGALALLPGAEWWMLIGGIASPLYITSGILLFPRMGALTSVGLFVTGQMLASVGLDLAGAIGVPQRPLTVGILLGAVAVLAGITTIIRAQTAVAAPAGEGAKVGGPGAATAPKSVTGGTGGATGAATIGWIVLGLVAGGVLPVQGAINAQLRGVLAAPLAVALFSFLVAVLTITIVLLALLTTNKTPTPRVRPLARIPWWGWLGGACAAAYVTATFMLIPQIGAATTVALTVTGQQVASAVIDQYGVFRLPRRPLNLARVAGLVLLVAGSGLVQLT